MALGMEHPGDRIDVTEEAELFSLARIKVGDRARRTLTLAPTLALTPSLTLTRTRARARARALTKGERGLDAVIDVSGDVTLDDREATALVSGVDMGDAPRSDDPRAGAWADEVTPTRTLTRTLTLTLTLTRRARG